MTLIVRKVSKSELEIVRFIVENLIESIQSRPTEQRMQKLLMDNSTYLFAALLDDHVIGYALAYKFPSLYVAGYLAYLYDIEVLESFRRKGAGRLLIETVLSQLKIEGVNELWLGTATDNVEAQALFGSTGGIKSGETFNDFTYLLT